jgi:hypothetical protein
MKTRPIKSFDDLHPGMLLVDVEDPTDEIETIIRVDKERRVYWSLWVHKGEIMETRFSALYQQEIICDDDEEAVE